MCEALGCVCALALVMFVRGVGVCVCVCVCVYATWCVVLCTGPDDTFSAPSEQMDGKFRAGGTLLGYRCSRI